MARPKKFPTKVVRIRKEKNGYIISIAGKGFESSSTKKGALNKARMIKKLQY